jgi:uncharacterized membrane protein SirB2
MIEFYPQIKFVHVIAVIASGSLFALRAVLLQLVPGWARAAPVRYLSYSIDTVLLTAALMLMTVLHQYPIVHSWLTVKIALIVVYIVLGSWALKRARGRRSQVAFAAAALLVFGFVVSIARTHSAWGVFLGLRP